MREICKSGSMRGMWKRGYGWLLRHRQTKGTATAMQNLLLPRHIPTLPAAAVPTRKKRPFIAAVAAAILVTELFALSSRWQKYLQQIVQEQTTFRRRFDV
jgi:hypothetical protein